MRCICLFMSAVGSEILPGGREDTKRGRNFSLDYAAAVTSSIAKGKLLLVHWYR